MVNLQSLISQSWQVSQVSAQGSLLYYLSLRTAKAGLSLTSQITSFLPPRTVEAGLISAQGILLYYLSQRIAKADRSMTSQITSYLCRRAVEAGMVSAHGSLLYCLRQVWLTSDLTNNLPLLQSCRGRPGLRLGKPPNTTAPREQPRQDDL
jgi:hypothetical protein